jgi:hypothetical protein
MTIDNSVSSFNKLFNNVSKSLLNSSLAYALANFAVNFINTSYLLYSYNPTNIINKDGQYTPTLYFDLPFYDQNTNTFYINNLHLDKPGIIYMILTFSRKITYDKLTGNVNIDIRPAIKPTTTQILNCLDGYS